MKYDDQKLIKIYERTSGKCHLCHKKLAFKNYAVFGARGAWEVEHSKPRATGGTDHLNNLFAACIACNRQKGTGSNYSVRSKNGVRKSPLSAAARRKFVATNTAAGLVAGATIGRFLGPGGMIAGAIIGALVGSDQDPDR